MTCLEMAWAGAEGLLVTEIEVSEGGYRAYENIFKETLFRWRYVCKPTTHCEVYISGVDRVLLSIETCFEKYEK